MKFNLKKFLEIVSTVGPVVLATIPGGDKIAPVIPKIVDGIKSAEAMQGASGAEKKRHVLNIVASGAAVANATGKVKVSAADLEAIASQGIDTVIATVHVIEGAKVVKGNTGTAPAPGAAAALAGSVPGVDTAPRSSDLPGGHATHGHGSADNIPQAGTTRAAAEGHPDTAPASDTPAPGVDAGNAPSTEPPADSGANRPPTD